MDICLAISFQDFVVIHQRKDASVPLMGIDVIMDYILVIYLLNLLHYHNVHFISFLTIQILSSIHLLW